MGEIVFTDLAPLDTLGIRMNDDNTLVKTSIKKTPSALHICLINVPSKRWVLTGLMVAHADNYSELYFTILLPSEYFKRPSTILQMPLPTCHSLPRWLSQGLSKRSHYIERGSGKRVMTICQEQYIQYII